MPLLVPSGYRPSPASHVLAAFRHVLSCGRKYGVLRLNPVGAHDTPSICLGVL